MKKGGFALVEVVVALGLISVVMAATFRLMASTDRAGRSAEAVEAATLLLRSMVAEAERLPPWLPSPQEREKALSREELADLLQRQGTSLTNPSLYEAQVAYEEGGEGPRYRFQVCVRLGEERKCLEQALFAPRAYAEPVRVPGLEGGNYLPDPGVAHLSLRIGGPDGGVAAVEVAGERYTRYGVFGKNLPPGEYEVRALEATSDRYSYRPSPPTQTVRLAAGEAREAVVVYACTTGALALTVTPPPGTSLPQGTVRLNSRDVTSGGLVPYLPPGTYSLQAEAVRAGPYTYVPRFTPGTSVTVSPCNTAQASVNYDPRTGALRVNLTPPPEGSPSVRVRGAGFERVLEEGGLLEDLEPGDYEVLPQDVLSNGVRYRAQASPASVRVAPGETALSEVVYAPVSGKLTVLLSGSQGAPPPKLRVEGPNWGTTLTAYGSHGFDDLPPGTYVLRGEVVSDALYTYAATPAEGSVDLAAGERKTVSVAYAPASGALRVTVEGLPQGVSPGVVSVGGTALSQAVQTFPYLTPGTYQVEAREFVHEGYVYRAASPLRVEVRPGALAEARVTYARLEGTIRVEVAGLPSGVQASWTLSGPNGYSRSGTGPEVLTGLPTGTYRFEVRDVEAGGIVYRGSGSPQEGNLDAGGSLTFRASYVPVTGNLQVEASGLPGGQRASVVVSGPGGYSQEVAPPVLLTRLLPGTYVLEARDLQVPLSTPYGTLSYTYKPDAYRKTVEVVAGSTAQASFTFAKEAGTLRISVENPTGASVQLSVSGPGGFRVQPRVTGTSFLTYADVPAGTYAVTPPELRVNGMTYKAEPSTGNLASGQTLTLGVRYVPATGRIDFTVSMAQGAPLPTVILRKEGREVARKEGTSGSFEDLLPGRYVVEVLPLQNQEGFRYEAEPVTVDLAAGVVGTANLLLVKKSFFVKLSVTGVPAGTTAQVDLSGGVTRTLSFSGDGEKTVELPLGTYQVFPRSLAQGGYTYRGTATPSTVGSTTPGSLVTTSVVYREDSATVRVAVSGLPDGATASVALRGPVTRSKFCGNGPCVFERLPLGSYTLEAGRYDGEVYRYEGRASPTSYVLAEPGQVAEGTLGYAPVDGALSLSVSGPQGMPTPRVVVKDGSGSVVAEVRSLGTSLVPHLRPGTYSFQADRVTDGEGLPYAPSPSSGTVEVRAGETASVSVSYEAQVGTLSLTLSGLPSGGTVEVRVEGTGYVRSLTLGNVKGYRLSVPVGSYTVTAMSYASGGAIYRASPASFQVSVAKGGETRVSFAYTVRPGALAVVVSGLPPGASVEATLSGPSSRTLTLTEGTNLVDGLLPGSYVLTPAVYTGGGRYYAPSPASTTVVVSSEATSQASFAYSEKTASLTISVTGLPTPPYVVSVEVSGPVSKTVSVPIGGSLTLTGLPPGTYTVTPPNPIRSSYPTWPYYPTPEAATLSLPPDGTGSAKFVYQRAGWLYLYVSGLPSGYKATIEIQGPTAMRVSVGNGSNYLGPFKGGSYTAVPEEVNAGGSVYAASPQSFTVAWGYGVTVYITYSRR